MQPRRRALHRCVPRVASTAAARPALRIAARMAHLHLTRINISACTSAWTPRRKETWESEWWHETCTSSVEARIVLVRAGIYGNARHRVAGRLEDGAWRTHQRVKTAIQTYKEHNYDFGEKKLRAWAWIAPARARTSLPVHYLITSGPEDEAWWIYQCTAKISSEGARGVQSLKET